MLWTQIRGALSIPILALSEPTGRIVRYTWTRRLIRHMNRHGHPWMIQLPAGHVISLCSHCQKRERMKGVITLHVQSERKPLVWFNTVLLGKLVKFIVPMEILEWRLGNVQIAMPALPSSMPSPGSELDLL